MYPLEVSISDKFCTILPNSLSAVMNQFHSCNLYTNNLGISLCWRSHLFLSSGGRDFASGSFNFTLNPSRTQDCFSVQPINDSIVEDNETFTLQLSTTADRVNTDPDTSTITIEDDDSKLWESVPCAVASSHNNVYYVGTCTCFGYNIRI